MKTKASSRGGFTLVEIMIVVAIIGLLAAIAIPNFVKARASSQTNACINNLRQIDSAKQEWALENGKTSADIPAPSDLLPYVGRGSGSLANVFCPLVLPGAPLGGYTVNAVGTAPECNQAPLVAEHPAVIN